MKVVGDWVAVGLSSEIKTFYFDSEHGLEDEIKLKTGPDTLFTKLPKRGLMDLFVNPKTQQALIVYPYHSPANAACDNFLRFTSFDGTTQTQSESIYK